MFAFRRYIMFLPKLIQNLQDLQQSLSLDTIPIDNTAPIYPRGNVVCDHSCVVNVGDQTSQAFVTGLCTFCDGVLMCLQTKECQVNQSCHDEKVWDSWDHYPFFAMIQEYEDSTCFYEETQGKMDRMEAQNRRAKKLNSRKMRVMRCKDVKFEEDLGTIRKVVEDAAGKVAHSTKNERETLQHEHRRM